MRASSCVPAINFLPNRVRAKGLLHCSCKGPIALLVYTTRDINCGKCAGKHQDYSKATKQPGLLLVSKIITSAVKINTFVIPSTRSNNSQIKITRVDEA